MEASSPQCHVVLLPTGSMEKSISALSRDYCVLPDLGSCLQGQLANFMIGAVCHSPITQSHRDRVIQTRNLHLFLMVREAEFSRLRCPHGWVGERKERKEGGRGKERREGIEERKGGIRLTW